MRNKLKNYLGRLKFWTPSGFRLRKLYRSGSLALIPVGFRCFTKNQILENLGLSFKTSLPFDYGFFPPESVAKILEAAKFKVQGDGAHVVGTKSRASQESSGEPGIVFQGCSYEEINSAVSDKSIKNMNRYLDDTYGYYTIFLDDHFVLAHYNWHRYAAEIESSRIYDPVGNIEKIEKMLNRRMERMFSLVEKAKTVVFVYCETQGFKYMKINENVLDLQSLEPIREAAERVFSSKDVYVENLEKIDSPSKLLEFLDLKKMNGKLV